MTHMNIKSGLLVHAEHVGREDFVAKPVGTVDCLDGEHYIKLRYDEADGKAHWIPLGWVKKVDDKAVYLNKTQEEFRHGQLNTLPLASTLREAA